MRWTSAGDVHDHRGHLVDDKTLMFTAAVQQPGASLTLTFPTAQTMTLRYDRPAPDASIHLDGSLSRR